MWYKLIEKSDKSLWVVAFDGSTPAWKTLMFARGGGTSLERLRQIAASIDSALYWDSSYIDDNDLSEIPELDSLDDLERIDVKPGIDMIKASPNQSDRNGSITHIVLHNTAGSFAGSISWLCNPIAKASAHLVISRQGQTASLVSFAKKAWHAGNSRFNSNSIGIEIEATNSQRGMTFEQEKKVVQWVRHLMDYFEIPLDNVIIHRWVRNTDCPDLIWETDDEFKEWRDKNLR